MSYLRSIHSTGRTLHLNAFQKGAESVVCRSVPKFKQIFEIF